MNDYWASPYNPHDPHPVVALTNLYRDHMVGQHNPDMLNMDGFPVARYLQTAIIVIGGVPAGFLSIETRPTDGRDPAVELIYIAPEARGRGIARGVLEDARDACPRTLHAKGPFTAAGRALAQAVGLPEHCWTPEEQKEVDMTRLENVRSLAKECKHKRPNPSYACKRCQKRNAVVSAEGFVALHAMYMNGPTGPAGPVAQAIIDRNRKVLSMQK